MIKASVRRDPVNTGGQFLNPQSNRVMKVRLDCLGRVRLRYSGKGCDFIVCSDRRQKASTHLFPFQVVIAPSRTSSVLHLYQALRLRRAVNMRKRERRHTDCGTVRIPKCFVRAKPVQRVTNEDEGKYSSYNCLHHIMSG